MHATGEGAKEADEGRFGCGYGIGRAVRAGAEVDNGHRAVSSAEADTCCDDSPNEKGRDGIEIPCPMIG